MASEPLGRVDMIGPFTDVHGRQAHLGVDHEAVVLAGFPLLLPEARRLHAALGLAIEDREAWISVQPYSRPCCDHCNNLEGDPDGHDYGDETAHDGPCAECAEERYLAERNAD